MTNTNPSVFFKPVNKQKSHYYSPQIEKKKELKSPSYESEKIKLRKMSFKIERKCSCQKVLIVDDNMFNIMSLKLMFEQMNFTEFEEAWNGQEAVDRIVE